MSKKLRNVTPGEILQEDFLDPLELTQADLSRAIDLPVSRVAALVHGRISVSAEIDLRLSRYFGLSEGYWLRLQQAHDLMEARRRLKRELSRIVPRAA